MYLSQEEVFNTLRNVGKIATLSTSIVFDYLDMDAFKPDKTAKRPQKMIKLSKHAGEPIKFISKTVLNKYYACEHMHFTWGYSKIIIRPTMAIIFSPIPVSL